MKDINEILKKYNYKPNRYQKKGKTTIVDTDSGCVVIKKKEKNNEYIKNYLKSRNFNYHPKIITTENDYEVTEYIESVDIPVEQKIIDLIELVSLLHNKTTHYKEITEDYFKELYEDLSNNIYYLTSYYNDLIAIIEKKIYMDPSEYLLARNISRIYASLNFCKVDLEKWYELVKTKKQTRLVVLHNNLNLSHFIRNSNSYLVSWDKSKIDNPIFDLYKLYRNHGDSFDFTTILKRYESTYPLLPEERKLFFILISLPSKIEFTNNIFRNCQVISKEMDLLFKTEVLISPYYSKETIT
ncbi:MAG: hypothetical protein RRY16_03315 [Bacilli bacterium]